MATTRDSGIITKNRDSFIRPLIASVPAFLQQLLCGAIEGHSAVLLPQLYKSKNFNINLEQESWIASLGVMGTPLAAILSGPLVERYGRKFIFYVFYIMTVLGFSFIGFAQRLEHIYIGRTLCAGAVGFLLCSTLYIYEICAAHQRNTLVPLLCPMCSSGIFYAYVIGGYLPWNIGSLVLAVSGIVGLICIFFIPESPAWLVTRGDGSSAIKSLRWLKRDETNIVIEIEELKIGCCSEDLGQSISFQHFIHPTIWKPFVILLIFSVLQNGSGFYMLLFYTVNFFQDLTTRSDIDPLNIAVALAAMRILSGFVGAFFIAKFSRKKLTATSASGMFIAASAAVAYLVYNGEEPIGRPQQWFLVFCSLSYVILCTLAIQPLPWLLTNELYPLQLRGLMSGATNFCLFSTIFIGIKAYPFLVYYIHMTGVLCVFATACFLAVFFAIFLLPETLNKTPKEIEEYFMKRNKDSTKRDAAI